MHIAAPRTRKRSPASGQTLLLPFDDDPPLCSSQVTLVVAAQSAQAQPAPDAPPSPLASPAEGPVDVASPPRAPEQRLPVGIDFTITCESDLVGGNSSRIRIDANLAAIRLLKWLQSEGRLATPDEQHTLTKYVGWGATDLARIVGAAEPEAPREAATRAELRALLPEAEFLAVRETILNAHYSFINIPRAMWRAVQILGFQGGRILEPSVGVGHFLGTMPAEIRAASEIHAVEIDPVTAAIARQLYQTAHVQAIGLEAARLPPAYFDLAIGNVPFGKYGVADPTFNSPERTPLARTVHNYFFAKTLDLVRPGGLIVFVTSRYTMDSSSSLVRRYIARHADFLGAVRLPRSAFSRAGTEVVADIIALRKRATNAPETHAADWLDTDEAELSPRDRPSLRLSFTVNNYFRDHPRQVVGTASADGRIRGKHSYTVDLDAAEALEEALEQALRAIPAGSYNSGVVASTRPQPPSLSVEGAKDGEFHVDAMGRVFTTVGPIREPLTVTSTAKLRIQRFVALRDAYRHALTAMLEQRDPSQVSLAQQRLRRAYDTFVRAHGPVNSAANRRAISDDPESARILALEDVQWVEPRRGAPRKPVVTRLADIFTKVTISTPQLPTHAESPRDALAHSLAWKGHVDLQYMATLCKTRESEILSALAGKELFRDPLTDAWTTRDDALSGDVVSKLEAAQTRAEVDPASWQPAVDALLQVQPPRLEAEDIDIRLGSAWVPFAVYRDFAASQLDVSSNDVLVQFVNTETLSRWNFTPATGTARGRAERHELNVGGRNFFDLITDAANAARPEVRRPAGPNTDATVPDPELTNALRESIRQVDERFREWWREAPARAKALTELYNRTFNRQVLRTFDGSHVILPGSNPDIVLRPHQRAVIWRVVQTGNTLIAHAVGAGKTFALIGAALEKRRLGLACKPLIAVPNHMLEQWRQDVHKLYPAAKVLVPTPSDLNGPAARQRFFGRIAAGDWDVVLLTHSAFELISVSKAAFEQFIEEQVSQLENYLVETPSDDGKKAAKQIELAIKRLKDKLVKRAKQWSKDKVLTWEELGVDMLLIDEAHYFKNLFFSTKLNRIAGLSQSESDRAIDMFLKVRHLNSRTNSRGVVFATGTPVCNAVSELFTMQRYLAMQQLNTLGLANFDCWKAQFADVVELAEPAPEGGYRTRARLRQYSNVGELIVLFRQFADVLTADDLSLPVPRLKNGRPTLVIADPPPEFAFFLNSLRHRVQCVRSGTVDPRVDNMLKITAEASAAAVDLRLVNPLSPDHPTGRLTQAADRIASIHRRWNDRLGTQLVFLDIGIPRAEELEAFSVDDVPLNLDAEADDPSDVPTDDEPPAPAFAGRNLYGDLKRKLIARGVPAAHIAYIHQARNDADKKRLFQAVNDGRIRILFCSTHKGGVGMNIQRRLVALHHLDVPWRPADLEQREGRIIRQGNLFFELDPTFEIEIFRYVTTGSFDQYRWGLLSVKQSFISQLLRGRIALRTFEDHDTSQLSFDQAAAAASGDPRTFELLEGRQALARLEARYTLHRKRNTEAKIMMRRHAESEDYSLKCSEQLREFARALDTWDRRVSLDNGKFCIDRTEERAALRDALTAAIREHGRRQPSESVRVAIGQVGDTYTVDLHITRPSFEADSPTWTRDAYVELVPAQNWRRIRDTVSHHAPRWTITENEFHEPPDYVRSFDTKWKSSEWANDLAQRFTARAREANEARTQEEAIAARTFAHEESLDSTRRRVRQLEHELRAPDASTALPSSADDAPTAAVAIAALH